MMDDGEEIVLEMEEERLTCKKSTLTEHSDYFKVMFEGNFVERHQAVIKLQDVDSKSLAIILNLITDAEYVIEEEDLLLVLQTACMLQFDKIRSICTERATEILNVKNCLRIWHTAESLDLTPLYLKAKNLSLTEFDYIKDTDCLLELNIKQLHDYLANIFLIVKSEVDVFTSCMKWWYENSTKEAFTLNFNDATKLFYYFITFLDFNALSNNDIKEIITYPDIDSDKEIILILNNIINIRNGNYVDDKIISKEKILLNCRRRMQNKYPCILIDVGPILSFYDVHYSENRQRHAVNIKNILLFHTTNSNFKKLMTVPPEKYANLEGFHLLGYKELIFLFGGEIYWGRGNWSNNFWVYDTIRERWERKTKMPYGRRHFESCIADDVVYIVGGTGNFRLVQDNMFWYNYKLNQWSKLIPLPCSSRQIKCCEYKNSLFLLNVNNKHGYLFNLSMDNWIELKICDTNCIVKNFPEKFVVFSYEDFIYIKGSSIIKLKLIDNQLEVISTTFIKPINFDSIESTMCGGFIYTIYKQVVDDFHSIVFDKFDISNCLSEVIMEYDIETMSDVKLGGESCRFNRGTKLFSLSHYSMVEENTYLTDVSL